MKYDGSVSWVDRDTATQFDSMSDFYVWFQVHSGELGGQKCNLVDY